MSGNARELARGRVRRHLARLLVLTAVTAWVVVLRPVSLGGPAGYVVVAGHSMQPALYADALVLTMRAETYLRGDIVAFHVSGGGPSAPLVIHRIVDGSAKGGFRTQGDNMALPDPWLVLPEQIVGRQVAAIAGGGGLIALVRAPIVLASLAAGASTYLVLGWLPARRQDLRPAASSGS